jgi:hypothetical protein
MTYNSISQNDDDAFYTAVCAHLRGEPNSIVLGTVGEEQAEIATRILQDNPAIFYDKVRLLAEIGAVHYRESGMEAAEAYFADMSKKQDDDLFANLVAYVRDESHEIKAGTNGEAWAKDAKELASEDPAILDDQARLLAAVRGWSAQEEVDPEPENGWRVHNRRVNRNCISKTEYERRMKERCAAGLLIDPSTAEIDWDYAQTLDPYDDGLPLLPVHEQVGREYFACAPGSAIWVSVSDLPETTRAAIWKRLRTRRARS